ncbi:MAG: tetratricopeptide repeat protein [Alkalispirochaetaceae bacterium]
MKAFYSDSDYITAMSHFLAGDWAEAETAFAALDEKHRNEPYLKLLRGNIDYSRGNLDEAVEQYNAAVELNPEYGNAYYKLGVCYYRMGQLDKALDAFRKVVEIKDQSHAMASYFVGLIELFLGRDRQAGEAFEIFHEMSPESRIANFYLAQMKIRQKEFREAKELLEELLEATPGFAEVHYMLGVTHYGLHNNTEAVRCFQKALEINPEDERSKSKLALITEVQWP